MINCIFGQRAKQPNAYVTLAELHKSAGEGPLKRCKYRVCSLSRPNRDTEVDEAREFIRNRYDTRHRHYLHLQLPGIMTLLVALLLTTAIALALLVLPCWPKRQSLMLSIGCCADGDDANAANGFATPATLSLSNPSWLINID